MLYGGLDQGGLEIRKSAGGATRLQGRFPYGQAAVLSDGGRTGRPRKEVIAPRAFSYRLDKKEEDIHLLLGHDYAQPLASRGAGTLDIRDTDEAVIFTALITAEMSRVSWVADLLIALAAGLIIGLSPGFRIPPKRAVEDAESVEDEGHDPENGAHNALIRTIKAALLYEMSLVTRPAYPETQIEMRDWSVASLPVRGPVSHLNRWRL